MNTGKRAVLYLVRKKSKSITLLIVLTILSTLILIGVSIGNATDTAIENLYSSLGGYFKIERNIESSDPEAVTDDLIADVMENGEISAYNGMDLLYLLVEDIELEPGRFTEEGEKEAKQTRFLGNTDSSLNEYFTLGILSLKEGRHIQAEDAGKAVISDALAERNGLSVGDTFSAAYFGDNLTKEEQSRVTSHELEVVGIYESTQSQDNSNSAECDIVENFIFTDTAFIRDILEEINGHETNQYTRGATFLVANARKFDSIINGLSQMEGYNWDGLTITENNEAYQESAIPLIRLSGFLSTLVLVVFFISAVILSLILLLWMRDRIHEIGIFLSIGIRKNAIIGQHILENLIVAVFAFILACGISIGAASQVGKMVDNTVVENKETVQSTGLAALETQTAVKLLQAQETDSSAAVDIQIGLFEILEILGIEVIIVIVSTGISSIVVLRMHPRNILSSMN